MSEHDPCMQPSGTNRRAFLKQTAATATVGWTILQNAASVYGTPANDKVILGLIGAGGRGSYMAADFAARGDGPFAYVCDPDRPRAEALVKTLSEKQKSTPKIVEDYHAVLDDPAVDAVVIATPDHWHALPAIRACQAKKDVYVEKPASQCAWEGKQMLAAARKYQRVMQVGTQTRSAPYALAAKQYIADGKLGKIHFVRIYDQKEWANFPAVPDGDPPAGLNWDLWNGAAPAAPYNSNFHRNWHHFWRFSSGDIINDSIHQIDLARWVLGLEYPQTVYSVGARYEAGAAETPDTQIAVYEFPDMLVNFEMTLTTPYMLKAPPVIRQSPTQFPYWPQSADKIEIYGSEGVMYLGRHGGGWQVYGRPKLDAGVLVAKNKGLFPDPEHKENFLQCVRSRALPNADIQEGHRSVLWAHYATMSYRLGGQKLTIDPKTEGVMGNEQAMAMFRREYRAPYAIEDEV